MKRSGAARAQRATANDADTARRHFQELLEAKQERVRQGPSWPHANAFTGQRPADGAAAPSEPATQPPGVDQAAPESTWGDARTMHGRGNQGMRPQK